jgi:hypothetical protein
VTVLSILQSCTFHQTAFTCNASGCCSENSLLAGALSTSEFRQLNPASGCQYAIDLLSNQPQSEVSDMEDGDGDVSQNGGKQEPRRSSHSLRRSSVACEGREEVLTSMQGVTIDGATLILEGSPASGLKDSSSSDSSPHDSSPHDSSPHDSVCRFTERAGKDEEIKLFLECDEITFRGPGRTWVHCHGASCCY